MNIDLAPKKFAAWAFRLWPGGVSGDIACIVSEPNSYARAGEGLEDHIIVK